MTAAAVLFFLICSYPAAAGEDPCEGGEIRAASCERARAWLDAGLRPHQRVRIIGCHDEQR